MPNETKRTIAQCPPNDNTDPNTDSSLNELAGKGLGAFERDALDWLGI